MICGSKKSRYTVTKKKREIKDQKIIGGKTKNTLSFEIKKLIKIKILPKNQQTKAAFLSLGDKASFKVSNRICTGQGRRGK